MSNAVIDMGLRIAGLKPFYADEHGTYYVKLEGEQKVIHWVGKNTTDFNQMEINGDMIAVIMGAEDDYTIIKETPVTELPKLYIADGWSLLKANEGMFKNYVLFRQEFSTIRFTRIVYIRDILHGVNQISISEEVGKAFIDKLAQIMKYKESGQ